MLSFDPSRSWCTAPVSPAPAIQNRWPKSIRRQVLQASALAGADASGVGATTADGHVAAQAVSGGMRSTISQVS